MKPDRQSVVIVIFLIIVYVLCLCVCHSLQAADDHVASPALKRLIAYHGKQNAYFTGWDNRTYFYRNGRKVFIN